LKGTSLVHEVKTRRVEASDNDHELHSTVIVCHFCDHAQRIGGLPLGRVVRCGRCKSRLYTRPRSGLNSSFALLLAAVPLFFIGNLFPLLTLEIQGRSQTTTITGASFSLYEADMAALALIVWFTTVIGPAIVVASQIYVLIALQFSWRLPFLRPLLVWTTHLSIWGMMDVFLLGKLVGMADVVPGPGLYAYTLLIFVTAAGTAKLEPHLMWQRLERMK
jgi:paraquat-inducible protein A